MQLNVIDDTDIKELEWLHEKLATQVKEEQRLKQGK